MSEQFRREVRFEKGHTKRKTPEGDFGIAAMSIRFLLHGPHGVTQFLLYTGWYPEKIPTDRGYGRSMVWHTNEPTAFDLGYHAEVPQYEEQHDMECDVLPAGRCYYDGSSLRADRVLERFFLEGEDGVWSELESEYRTLKTSGIVLTVARPKEIEG